MDNTQQSVELGQLLANTVESVVKAQDRLDRHAAERVRAYETAQLGTLTLPPLWYTFTDVSLEVELSASIRKSIDPDSRKEQPRLYSQLLNPASVGLYGYQASSALKVSIRMAPKGVVPIKAPTGQPASQTPTE